MTTTATTQGTDQATTTPATTADPTPDVPSTPLQARPQRSGLSVRVRIVATVALLVLMTLSLAGFVVYLVEAERLNEQTIGDSNRLLDEFAQQQQEPHPVGKAPKTLDDAFGQFLGQEVTNGQIMIGISSTGHRFGSSHDPLVYDEGFLADVQPIVATGGSVRLDTSEGPVLAAAQPVRVGDQSGALVVISNLSEDRQYLHDTLRTYTAVSALSFLVVVLVAFWQSGRLLAPLRTLRQTAEEISGSDLSRRLPERGNDDITALTRTVNGMLARLEAAFVGQREFLDDAGHELKTPLTILRGHLELLDTGSPQEVTETRDLLLDEVDRMARLVGDLILLAKTERPDFLTLRPVDVGELTRTVLAKATGLGDRTWLLDGAADVRAGLDEQRVTQALLQLADNAVKHTRPGDEVAVGSSFADGVLRVWVRDTGPGVTPADHERIFERFGRSDVPDDDEGFGLGLSIVAAIAQAHGGRAYLDPAPAQGARFVIELPGEAD